MIKLGDFGIARVLRNTAELASTQIGTPYYMPPEIMDNKKYNSKADMWSLGVVLHETMCLRLPFQGSNIKQLVVSIMRLEPAPPPAVFSQSLRDVLKALLSKAPRARPSVAQVLAAPVVRSRISAFLDEAQLHGEFSHTVLHGAHILGAAKPCVIASAVADPGRPAPVAAPVVSARPQPEPAVRELARVPSKALAVQAQPVAKAPLKPSVPTRKYVAKPVPEARPRAPLPVRGAARQPAGPPAALAAIAERACRLRMEGRERGGARLAPGAAPQRPPAHPSAPSAARDWGGAIKASPLPPSPDSSDDSSPATREGAHRRLRGGAENGGGGAHETPPSEKPAAQLDTDFLSKLEVRMVGIKEQMQELKNSPRANGRPDKTPSPAERAQRAPSQRPALASPKSQPRLRAPASVVLKAKVSVSADKGQWRAYVIEEQFSVFRRCAAEAQAAARAGERRAQGVPQSAASVGTYVGLTRIRSCNASVEPGSPRAAAASAAQVQVGA